MAIQIVEIPNHQNKVRLRVAHGHFATSHSHINYYIDLTMTKHRLSEARIAAEELCGMYKNSTIVEFLYMPHNSSAAIRASDNRCLVMVRSM